ncbi:hypothetical protein [Mesorhizobium sp. STM 4661]|uniref:hypothetical protein n=1 Tax=Mesorhizobium sp. STM 4661 TaxID=1297570 RepID=UPI0002BF465D|nr:hypothetical protein [Mesorhizobium sp. STM 4661]CCV15403.1 conserved exported hypothetical protein [Mesorhizobium sp. STM 4661]
MKESTGLLVAAMFFLAGPAHATDADFLKSFGGSWSGKGTVKVEADSKPITINCKFASQATDNSLSLDGKCTGYVVFSRAIGADVKSNGKTYTGIYTGSSTGPAGLNGKRSGNALILGIHWAKEVNGDRSAQLRLEKVGANGMRLTTMDKDPATGKTIVISDINLGR